MGDAGDVAFIRQRTPPEYLNTGVENSFDESWNYVNGDSMDDYKLLCLEGGCQPLSAFTQCSFPKTFGHTVVASSTRRRCRRCARRSVSCRPTHLSFRKPSSRVAACRVRSLPTARPTSEPLRRPWKNSPVRCSPAGRRSTSWFRERSRATNKQSHPRMTDSVQLPTLQLSTRLSLYALNLVRTISLNLYAK